MTYRDVYLMDSLSIEAKAIYGMFCSLAGTGDTVYPSVDYICDKLKISRTRFYTHMNQLVKAGIVKKSSGRKEDGHFSGNVYTLIPNTRNPYTGNSYTENPHTDKRDTENKDTNNNTINNNTIKNNTFNNSFCPDPAGSDQKEAEEDKSGIIVLLTDGSGYDVPLSKIAKWTDAYPDIDVWQQLKALIVWTEENPDRRKDKRGIGRCITGWLARAQGKAVAQPATAPKKQTRFNNFEQRKYDYDDLESKLLDSQQK